MILTLRCPHCCSFMNYSPRGEFLNKRKSCVFCGKSFVINRDNISPQTLSQVHQKMM
jgi:hypothetical protein